MFETNLQRVKHYAATVVKCNRTMFETNLQRVAELEKLNTNVTEQCLKPTYNSMQRV